jgi:hypothetical protein
MLKRINSLCLTTQVSDAQIRWSSLSRTGDGNHGHHYKAGKLGGLRNLSRVPVLQRDPEFMPSTLVKMLQVMCLQDLEAMRVRSQQGNMLKNKSQSIPDPFPI